MSHRTGGEGPLRLGVLGGGSLVFREAVLPAVEARDDVVLSAVASRSGATDPRWDDVAVDRYEDVLAACEAVYVPLPNDLHRPWVEAAADAGVHVLCEKPLGLDATDAAAMANACADARVLLAEAWMTPFHPVLPTLVGLVRDGGLGDLRRVSSTFTFTIGPEAADNYRWSARHGGGALLDVGIYTLSPLLELLDDPEVVDVVLHRRGDVDATFQVSMRGAGGVVGTATGSFEAPERQRLVVTGTTGRVEVDRPFTPDGGLDRLVVVRGDGTTQEVPVDGVDPYGEMLGAFAAAVRGVAAWPRPVTEAVRLAGLLDRLRAAANVVG